jgi:hypothetical protein|tara:strand:+ start:117 stop:677 length:561 start_codon:yes stop_codon:yes gene_type:complete
MELIVPNSMADITVKQYREMSNIDLKQSETECMTQSICILCNIDRVIVEMLTLDELDKIGKVINKITDPDQNNQELQKKIEYKGKRYGFHPNLSKLTVGEFADLEMYCNGGYFENLNGIIGILYRPIVEEGGDFYTIEDYDAVVLPNYWDDLKMDVVLGATNFFLSIGESLTNGLVNYSKVAVNRT